MKIEELNMSARTTDALICNNITTVDELKNVTEEDVMHFRKFGRMSMQELLSKMEEINIRFKELN